MIENTAFVIIERCGNVKYQQMQAGMESKDTTYKITIEQYQTSRYCLKHYNSMHAHQLYRTSTITNIRTK